MLETVLKIGRAFRQSPAGLKHHRYVKLCPLDNKKEKVLRLSLPVRTDFTFDFDKIEEICDENIIYGERLFYPTFKTSDADSLVKYVFGDIYYTLSLATKKNKRGDWLLNEGGYYRLGDPDSGAKGFRVSSFYRGQGDFEDIERIYEKFLVEHNLPEKEIKHRLGTFIPSLFRRSFEHNINLIERLLRYNVGIAFFLDNKSTFDGISIKDILLDESFLKELTAKRVFLDIQQNKSWAKKRFKIILGSEEPVWNEVIRSPEHVNALTNFSSGNIFLHFDFGGKHWYEFTTEFEMLNRKMLLDFVTDIDPKNGDEPNSGFILNKYLYKTLDAGKSGAPGFKDEYRYRSKLFRDTDEVLDLVFAIDYSKQALITVPFSDIKIIVFPRGNNLSAEHFERFAERANSIEEVGTQEQILKAENESVTDDTLFDPLVSNVADSILQFDLVFSLRGSKGMDTDLIEISGIEKSRLREIAERIAIIKRDIQRQREHEFRGKEFKPLQIYVSFLNLLGDPTKDKKKYQSHLYKVLPQIYSASYYRDPVLLPALIEKTEFNIRNEQYGFRLLKYDFYFLTRIQNTPKESEHLMDIQQSQSYRIGTYLGKMARPLRVEIKSFEKSYVGNLRRRIATLDDLIEFKNFIEEKLVLHEKTYRKIRNASLCLAEMVKTFDEQSERYDKNKCAFGFFETYFCSVDEAKPKRDAKETVLNSTK